VVSVGSPSPRSIVAAVRFVVEWGVVGLALGTCVAAVGAQGGRWNDRLDLLTHFAPLWLASGLVSLLLAVLVLRRWRRWTFAALSLIAVISATTLLAVDLRRLPDRYAAADPARTLKIITFNAWTRNRDIREVARWVAAENPDILVLPEGSGLLAEAIRAETGLRVFEGSGAFIATRDKPLDERVAWDARFLAGGSTALSWVVLRGPDGAPFTVVGVHCGWPIPARAAWADAQKITALLNTMDRSRTILAGDFNSTQWSFRQRVVDAAFGLERRDRAHLTWPARLPMFHGIRFPWPFLSIDHLYAGGAWRTVSVKRGPEMGSDHYPLVATLAWLDVP
jgi:endonuclease/exonuclease/phosphatase (EEP) superfamily protein YafD